MAEQEHVDSDDDSSESESDDRSDSTSLSLSQLDFSQPESVKHASPQTLKGYLWKKGGLKGKRGWDRRWFVFGDGALKYFRNEAEEEKEKPSGLISVGEIVSIKLSPSKAGHDRKFRFQLHTPSRVYYFSAENGQDMGTWLNLLSDIRSVDSAPRMSFDFSNCSKSGFLSKTGGSNKTFRKRWFVLQARKLFYFQSPEENVPLGHIDFEAVTEIAEEPPEASCSFKVVTAERTFHLRAESIPDMRDWMTQLRSLQIFGLPLRGNGVVPAIVSRCVEFVETRALDAEGIYRISGSQALLQKLRTRFNQNDETAPLSDDLTGFDVSGLLRMYFRELPEPLVAPVLNACIKASAIADHEQKLRALRQAVYGLPPTNLAILKVMCHHLALVSSRSPQNKMSIDNLVLIFAPSFMVGDMGMGNMRGEFEALRLLLQYHEWIFCDL